jgi:hypothetical protein
MAKKDYRRDEHKNSSSSFNFAPTNVCPSVILEGEDYGLKVSLTVLISI